MAKNPRTKIAWRRAIFALATERGVSYTVAAHIIKCMSIAKRGRFLMHYRPSNEEWERIKNDESQ